MRTEHRGRNEFLGSDHTWRCSVYRPACTEIFSEWTELDNLLHKISNRICCLLSGFRTVFNYNLIITNCISNVASVNQGICSSVVITSDRDQYIGPVTRFQVDFYQLHQKGTKTMSRDEGVHTCTTDCQGSGHTSGAKCFCTSIFLLF